MESKEQLFGIKSTEYIDSELNFLSVMKNIFTSQNVMFWLLTYGISIILHQFFMPSGIIRITALTNVILFPFAVIFIGSIANRFIFSVPLIYGLTYPTYKNIINQENKLMLIIGVLVKCTIYIIVWRYAFILGIIGLVLTIKHARKFTKWVL